MSAPIPPSRDDATGSGSQPAGSHPAGPAYTSGLSRAAAGKSASPPQREQRKPRASKPSQKESRKQLDPPTGGRTLAAGQVLMAGLVGLVLAAFLNADALVRDAERKEFGTGRDISLAFWEPLQSASNAIGLTEPRRVADEALGRDSGDDQLLTVSPIESTTPTTRGTTGTIPGSTPDTSAPIVASTVVPTTVASTTTTTEAPFAPTPDARLVLWVGGDSMAQVFGESLERLGSETTVIDPTLDYKISSGLTRPDFFNWPGRLADVVSEDDPDVMVVIFGANDAQGMELSNGVFQPFEDEWVAEYTSRVATAMDIVTFRSDRIVIWVGQPIMRSDNFDARMNRLNQVYIEQAALREQILYLDTRVMFSGSDGTYEPFLTALDGETRNMRQQDGTHLSRAGGDVLADAVLDLLGENVDLVSGRIPATTQPVSTAAP